MNPVHLQCTHNTRIAFILRIDIRTEVFNRTFTSFQPSPRLILEMIDDLGLWFNVWDKQISFILVCPFRTSKCSCCLLNQLSKTLSCRWQSLHLKDFVFIQHDRNTDSFQYNRGKNVCDAYPWKLWIRNSSVF